MTWEYKGAHPPRTGPRWFHFWRRARRGGKTKEDTPFVAKLRAAVAEEEKIIPPPEAE